MISNGDINELSEKDRLIVFHANDMLWLWRELNQQDKEGRGWYKRETRQAYHDSLLSLKRYGLIEAYDCVEVQTKINGKWYPDRQKLKFVQTGPEVEM